MKVTLHNQNDFNENYDMLDGFDTVIDNKADEKNGGKPSLAHRHPAITAALALTLFAVPSGMMGFNMLSSNAAEINAEAKTEQSDNSDLKASFVDAGKATDMATVESDISPRVIAINASANGTVEAEDNCVIADGKLTFKDKTKSASFKVAANDGYEVKVNSNTGDMNVDNGVITLDTTSDYGTVSVTFNEIPKPAETPAPAATTNNSAATSSAPATTSRKSTPRRAVTRKTTMVQQQQQTVPAQQQQQAAPAASTASSGQVQNSMTAEERAAAQDIFAAYNRFRASKGLSQVAWSEDCANMGYQSAKGCAAQGKLIHRLGIPAACQNRFSDILQYATYKMDGNTAVDKWSKSQGHRIQMQCATATEAAVGVYNNNGTWYFAIVYNFSGTNVGGN